MAGPIPPLAGARYAMMNTPQWWYRKDSKDAPWWRFALWPLSLLWQAVGAFKSAATKPYRSSLKVISVGNVTLGGSGKTPIAAEVLRLLSEAGLSASGLSRGYGGSEIGPVRVNPDHTAAKVGDEALLIARTAPLTIARDRVAGLKFLESEFNVAVIDDAHQNPTFVKDLHLLVVDGDTRDGAWPFGSGGVFPMGPLREPLKAGLARADAVVLWMPDAEAVPDPELLTLLPAPVFVAHLEAAMAPEGPLIAFAGIAKPWKFEATLKSQDADVRAFYPLPDHAPLTQAQLNALWVEANAVGAQIITTEKDWMRLSPEWRGRVRTLPIQARFRDRAFNEWLIKAVS